MISKNVNLTRNETKELEETICRPAELKLF